MEREREMGEARRENAPNGPECAAKHAAKPRVDGGRRALVVRLVVALALTFPLASCATNVPVGTLTIGGERRDAHGLVFVEHHIAGLRVLEAVIGGSADVPFDARLPVVLSIHGRGDRARLPNGRFAGLDMPVRLLVPEAADEFGDGYSWAPVSVTENRTPVLAAALALNADKLAVVLTTVLAARQVDGRPIVTGFSQGGMLAYTLAVRHPELVGAAVPVAGWIPRELLPQHMSLGVLLPTIEAVHGTADPIVRVGPTRRAVRRLRSLGFTVDLFEVEGARHLYTDALSAAVHERLVHAVAVAVAVASIHALPCEGGAP